MSPSLSSKGNGKGERRSFGEAFEKRPQSIGEDLDLNPRNLQEMFQKGSSETVGLGMGVGKSGKREKEKEKEKPKVENLEDFLDGMLG